MSAAQSVFYDGNSPPAIMQYQRAPVVEELIRYFNTMIVTQQKTAYVVSITYADSVEFPLSPASANRHLNQVHRSLLSHLSRRYNRPYFQEMEPIVYAFLDVPSSRIKKSENASSAPTRLSTYHHHCIVLVDERHASKFDELTDRNVADDFVYDCRQRCRIRTIYVERIRDYEHLAQTVSYATSYYRKNPDDIDRLQLYPSEKAKTKLGRILNDQRQN